MYNDEELKDRSFLEDDPEWDDDGSFQDRYNDSVCPHCGEDVVDCPCTLDRQRRREELAQGFTPEEIALRSLYEEINILRAENHRLMTELLRQQELDMSDDEQEVA